MIVIRTLLRWFSLLFHFFLSVFLIAVAGLAMSATTATLQMGMLPWSGDALERWLLFGGLFGLIAVLLAVRRTLPVLLLLWSLVVAILLVKGYFLGSYRFAGQGVSTALWLTGGSWLAVLGSWLGMSKPRDRR